MNAIVAMHTDAHILNLQFWKILWPLNFCTFHFGWYLIWNFGWYLTLQLEILNMNHITISVNFHRINVLSQLCDVIENNRHVTIDEILTLTQTNSGIFPAHMQISHCRLFDSISNVFNPPRILFPKKNNQVRKCVATWYFLTCFFFANAVTIAT